MWCFLDGIIKCHIEGLENKFGKLNAKLFAFQIWLGVSTLSKRLFTTNQRRFLLILICEGSQFFVWRNKAFIFFQKSDIKPKDGRKTLSPLTNPPPIHPNRTQLVQVAGRRICCWLRAAPLVFSISDSVSTESSVSEPELRLDNDPSERALGLDDLGVPLLWVWVSLEAPVALGVRVKFVDEVFR